MKKPISRSVSACAIRDVGAENNVRFARVARQQNIESRQHGHERSDSVLGAERLYFLSDIFCKPDGFVGAIEFPQLRVWPVRWKL